MSSWTACFARGFNRLYDRWAWVVFSGFAVWAAIEGLPFLAAGWGFVAGLMLALALLRPPFDETKRILAETERLREQAEVRIEASERLLANTAEFSEAVKRAVARKAARR